MSNSSADLLDETENKFETDFDSKNKKTFHQELEQFVQKTKKSLTKMTQHEDTTSALSMEFFEDILGGVNSVSETKTILSDQNLDVIEATTDTCVKNEIQPTQQLLPAASHEELPLSKLLIDVNTIQPGDEPPKTIHNDPAGLKIVLHFARDKPRDDVNLIVVNTTNQGSKSISKYNFDAIVSKVTTQFKKKTRILFLIFKINLFLAMQNRCT